MRNSITQGLTRSGGFSLSFKRYTLHTQDMYLAYLRRISNERISFQIFQFNRELLWNTFAGLSPL